jgi:hypothetical protein
MINEPVDWEESKNNLMTRPYRQPFIKEEQWKMISELDIILVKSEVSTN